MAYIRNAKFTSPNTWPMIHFMRRSMVEVFLLDPALAYKHAFIYIRQLTIHLRNGMINNNGSEGGGGGGKEQKKKENPLQTVRLVTLLYIILHTYVLTSELFIKLFSRFTIGSLSIQFICGFNYWVKTSRQSWNP